MLVSCCVFFWGVLTILKIKCEAHRWSWAYLNLLSPTENGEKKQRQVVNSAFIFDLVGGFNPFEKY